MRPERDNIAAPALPGEITWIGEQPQSMPALTAAGPVLVHFLDFSQLNSVRTLSASSGSPTVARAGPASSSGPPAGH